MTVQRVNADPAWHRVKFAGDTEDDDFDDVYFASAPLRVEMEDWCHHNCKQGWSLGMCEGRFENVRDAVLFKMWFG